MNANQEFVRVIVVTAVATLLVACSRSVSTTTYLRREFAAHSRLRDPGSAMFRDVVYSDLTTAFCGEVNAKNGFGGYAGWKYFIMAFGPDRVPNIQLTDIPAPDPNGVNLAGATQAAACVGGKPVADRLVPPSGTQ